MYSLDLERDSSQYAYRADTASLSVIGDLTLESWVKLESNSGDILSKFESGTDKRSYRFTINASGAIQIWVSSDGTAANTTSGTSTTTIPSGIWTHVAVSYNAAAGSCQFYKNGVYLSGEDGSGLKTSIQDNTSQFAIGCYEPGGPGGLF